MRDTLWDLPGWESCWETAVVVAVAVAAVGVTLEYPDGFIQCIYNGNPDGFIQLIYNGYSDGFIQFEYNGYPDGFIQCTFFQKQVLKMNSREAETPAGKKLIYIIIHTLYNIQYAININNPIYSVRWNANISTTQDVSLDGMLISQQSDIYQYSHLLISQQHGGFP